MPTQNAITRCADCRALRYEGSDCRNCGGSAAEPMPKPLRPFAIASRENSYVLDPSNWIDIATFASRKSARAYADSIADEMCSRDMPLRVVVYNGTRSHDAR